MFREDKGATMSKTRKRIFVNPAIQGGMLKRLACYWFVYHGVLWIALFFYRYAQYRGALLAGAAPQTFSELFGQFTQEHFSLWVCAVAILPIIVWDALLFSHRVVGPLVRFQRVLENLTAGERVAEVRLRHGDLLNDLQDTFNRYLTTLQSDRPLPEVEELSLDSSAGANFPSNVAAVAENHSSSDRGERELVRDLRELQTDLATSSVSWSSSPEDAPATHNAEIAKPTQLR
jgi:hypothetical protein